MHPRLPEKTDLRRPAVRIFFLVTVSMLSLDALPWGVLPTDRPKELLGELTNRLGLSQGQWMMFAPNPGVNNFWLSATVHDTTGRELESWSSPYWPITSGWEKFYHFRYINFFNQINSVKNRVAAQDLADYLSRTLADSAGDSAQGRVLVELYSNDVQLIRPDEGNLPSPDEITWVSQTTHLASSPKSEEMWMESPGIP